IFGGDAVTKRLQLLHEIAPKVGTTTYLVNPTNPNAEMEMRAAQAAASSLGRQLTVLRASNEHELDAAFPAMANAGAGALLVASDTFFFGRRDRIAALAARHRIPAMYYLPEFARAGG